VTSQLYETKIPQLSIINMGVTERRFSSLKNSHLLASKKHNDEDGTYQISLKIDEIPY
jgi:hypothetical protein